MNPIFSPPGYRLELLLAHHPDAQLWRAQKGGVQVALRLARYDGPLEPTAFFSRMQAIVDGLGLTHFAPLEAVGAVSGGFWHAERWSDGAPYGPDSQPTQLLPLLQELARLHHSQKWHGGLTLGRLHLGKNGFVALQFPWAAWLSTLPRPRAERLDGLWTGAPELKDGPRQAGPGLDTYALAQILVAQRPTPLLRQILAAPPESRPLLTELMGALRSA